MQRGWFECRGPGILVVLLLLAAAPTSAQQGADPLNEQQRQGRLMMGQSCGVCHLPPARNAKTYGPVLSKTTLGGDNALMRKVILEGTPRMPAFKYFLQPAEVDAIIAYVRTVSTPTPAPAADTPR